jgi:6-phosphogluconolactonase
MSSERFYLGKAEILVGADEAEALRIAAGQFAALARRCAAEGRTLNAALSGGGTAEQYLPVLAAEPFAGIIPWDSIQLFWADERNVPPGDAASNYALARRLLLSQVPVPALKIHRIPTGDSTAVEAAELYQRTLRELLPLRNGLPQLDYVFLGLGTNAHTASLFPHRPTLHEQERLVVADHVDEVSSWRVTLTAPMINNAAQVTFLALGKDKAGPVHLVLEGPRDPELAPAQLIAPTSGSLTWILDPAAASLLRRPTLGGRDAAQEQGTAAAGNEETGKRQA